MHCAGVHLFAAWIAGGGGAVLSKYSSRYTTAGLRVPGRCDALYGSAMCLCMYTHVDSHLGAYVNVRTNRCMCSQRQTRIFPTQIIGPIPVGTQLRRTTVLCRRAPWRDAAVISTRHKGKTDLHWLSGGSSARVCTLRGLSTLHVSATFYQPHCAPAHCTYTFC